VLLPLIWPQVSGEQSSRSLGNHSATVRSDADRNRHEPAIRRDVEQFFASRVPAHLSTATRRNQHALSGSGKRLDINLKSAIPVGLVSDPVSIRRKLSCLFFEGRADDVK